MTCAGLEEKFAFVSVPFSIEVVDWIETVCRITCNKNFIACLLYKSFRCFNNNTVYIQNKIVSLTLFSEELNRLNVVCSFAGCRVKSYISNCTFPESALGKIDINILIIICAESVCLSASVLYKWRITLSLEIQTNIWNGRSFILNSYLKILYFISIDLIIACFNGNKNRVIGNSFTNKRFLVIRICRGSCSAAYYPKKSILLVFKIPTLYNLKVFRLYFFIFNPICTLYKLCSVGEKCTESLLLV